MTEMRIHEFDKWLHQNDGEVADCCEGSLLDNYIVYCKHGVAFIFEEFLNAWSSAYHAYFFRDKEVGSKEYRRIECDWYLLADEAERDAG